MEKPAGKYGYPGSNLVVPDPSQNDNEGNRGASGDARSPEPAVGGPLTLTEMTLDSKSLVHVNCSTVGTDLGTSRELRLLLCLG